MELCPLQKVQHRVKVGIPLPFSIRDQGSKLLLAKNQIVANEEQLEALMDRGAFVNLDELRGARAEIYNAPAVQLSALWRKLGDQLSRVLVGMPSPQAPQALEDAARYLAALAERAPDLALYLIVRPDGEDTLRYGVRRGLHAAAAGFLVALRLGWPTERCVRLVKACFTMNLGMLDLQERLSNQSRAPSPAQRQAVQAHPMTSVTMLRDSGVADEEWLQAVAQHHERPGGGGYPAGLNETAEMADALRTVDIYTAKLAQRATRTALPPGQAARDLLGVERGNPFALALVTEFGLWPPGTLVRLGSGEIAVVVQRGADVRAPSVAVLTNRHGDPLVEPVQRTAAGREHGIVEPVATKALKVRISAERLYAKALF